MSFTAAAMPTSMPRRQRLRGDRQSSATSAISNRLTCPNHSVSHTGSSSRANGSSTTVPPTARSGHVLRRHRWITTPRLTNEIASMATADTAHGTAASGPRNSTANGG